jgi:hypothetical protein
VKVTSVDYGQLTNVQGEREFLWKKEKSAVRRGSLPMQSPAREARTFTKIL